MNVGILNWCLCVHCFDVEGFLIWHGKGVRIENIQGWCEHLGAYKRSYFAIIFTIVSIVICGSTIVYISRYISLNAT